MLNAKAFANAVTVVTAIFYLACLLISLVAPDFLFGVAQSWMHSVSIESLKAQTAPSWENMLWGFVTITVLTWVTTFVTIKLYNKFK